MALIIAIGGFPSSFASANENNSASKVTHEVDGHLDITTYYYEDPINFDFQTVVIPDEHSAMYIPYDGREYSQTTKTLYKKKAWGTDVRNDSSINDSVTRSVTRSSFANGSIGTAAETAVNWKLIQGKVGINAEAAWGKSTSITVSYIIGLPAKKRTIVEIGTKAVVTKGTVIEYRSGVAIKRTGVSADYSYDEYLDKKSTPL